MSLSLNLNLMLLKREGEAYCMKSSEIRQAFLDYFETRGHQVVPSSSLVPGNDPTLLFTNAGMVQFKDTFLGLDPRPYVRAASSQRCVRAGGKHNDLENVGYTARHHTFFEMLGNFSFGDYFKREAIQYAWSFLVDVLHLPPERLWVTVYENDDEAADIWLNEMGVSPLRFSRCGDKDNFWSMGDTGPCGPCTEIFYDHGETIPGGPPGTPEADGDRYIEIWNLVFMQFNRDKAGKLHPLPKPSVDTGMGLERITAVVQGVHNNYQIDSFSHLIQSIAACAQDPSAVNVEDASLKVIADHIRACAFLMVDGVVPGNEGRGYVLRRIIRRAVRHGHHLNLPVPFLARLVKPLIEVMGEAYPALIAQKAHIERLLEQEEQQFARTLEQGLRIFQEAIQSLEGQEIPGDVAFKLYDTYGFPVDLTADIARERGLSVDRMGFERCMQRQREQSQSASGFREDYEVSNSVLTHASSFEGYTQCVQEGTVIALVLDGQEVESIQAGARASVVLDATPFYAESGGQVGDRGWIQIASGDAIFRVDDTQRVGQAILHHGELVRGTLAKACPVIASIDAARRDAIRLNHTATHLLHAALKRTLGAQVHQKGSLVDADRARFDFSYHEALTPMQCLQVETLVNAQIRENHDVETQLMSMDDASKSGAEALFGEKYGDVVRVLSLGDFSRELCGGTHAARTGDLGLFKITAEYGVASGVRRIELVTGSFALDWVNQQLKLLENLASQLKTSVMDAPARLLQWFNEAKQHERALIEAQRQLAAQSGQALLADIQHMNGMNVLVKRINDIDAAGLRELLDQLRSRVEHAVIVLIGVTQEKMHVVVGVSQSLVGRAPSAAVLVRHLCGKGGGREDMAQGGGLVPEDLSVKMDQIIAMIHEFALGC
jgi:alanyl-tRNA synthetase